MDHGKTTLVQSLTGVWTSTHSQELKRGITIRVGYSDVAFYKCPKCSEPEGYSTESKCANCGKKSELTRVVSIVDSPGHESLMANMLSGAALMDGGILVIGADQKVPQLQTEEHLLALQILGIKQLVVVRKIRYGSAQPCIKQLELTRTRGSWKNHTCTITYGVWTSTHSGIKTWTYNKGGIF